MLLPRHPAFESAREIVEVYEDIYEAHTGVWVDQGRSRDLIDYFARLVSATRPRRVLEIGCGEGVLLAEIRAEEKLGTDLSVRALELTRERTRSSLCISLAERLPYPDGYFDTVASVGVMEHFLDDRAACGEVFRVLAPGGRYVTLLHVHLTLAETLRQKISEYVFPRPRPIALVRWLYNKVAKPIRQPVQNQYTVESARACLAGAGLNVLETINTASTPDAPFIGPHVTVFVCRKPDHVGA